MVASQHRVIMCLYRKPLAGNSFLMAQSNHPKHAVRGIPVGQFICTEDIDFDMEAALLYHRFRQRGYPIWALERGCTIARAKNREDLLKNPSDPGVDTVTNQL